VEILCGPDVPLRTALVSQKRVWGFGCAVSDPVDPDFSAGLTGSFGGAVRIGIFRLWTALERICMRFIEYIPTLIELKDLEKQE
jgi:hypothetical protein